MGISGEDKRVRETGEGGLKIKEIRRGRDRMRTNRGDEDWMRGKVRIRRGKELAGRVTDLRERKGEERNR